MSSTKNNKCEKCEDSITPLTPPLAKTDKGVSDYREYREYRNYQLDHPGALWLYRKYHYNGSNSEGNRFIRNKDL